MSASRSGILGFTEAELGLFLALLFLGVAVNNSPPPAPGPATAPTDSTRFAVVARLAAERDSLSRVMTVLGQTVMALDSQEVRLAARRDSLAALSDDPTSAVLARRTQLGDSVSRALDSVRVAREASEADRRMAVNRRELVESRIEPIVREEAAVLGVVASARRQRDSVLNAGASDTGTIRRFARLVDSLSALAADPVRRTALAAPAATLATAPSAPDSARTTDSGDAVIGGRGRSNQTPTCSELGIANGDIATIEIVGRNRFRVRGREGPMTAVLAALASEQAAAERAGCRHVVRVTSVPGLSVEYYVPALVDLRRVFNTSLVGPES